MKSLLKTLSVVLLSAGMALSVGAQAADTAQDKAAENTKPMGSICLQGQECAAAAAAPTGGAAKSGEEIFKASCTTCHTAGVSGAPKIGDAADWGARLSARGEAGLLEHAIKGFNAMPAKGLCFSCSDEELAGAVKYMLDNSK